MDYRTPLRIYCRNCGAPAGFDIIRQTYRCPYCATETGVAQAHEDVKARRKLDKKSRSVPLSQAAQTVQQFSCPSCGASVVFDALEASQTCDFCGASLVRRELSYANQRPELIIPFFLTADEARERLATWAKRNARKPEAKVIKANLGNMQSYYLPYSVVQGPVKGEISREGIRRKYCCAGYLEGTAVSSSEQMDNFVLNGMEPFDWQAARPFDYGFIAGHKVKLSDVNANAISKRALDEAQETFLPDVKKLMQTESVSIDLYAGELLTTPVLLPVYFIQVGATTAAVNGQTGRVSVSSGRTKTRDLWAIEPAIYTVLATVLLSIPYHFAPEAVMLFGAVFACLFFFGMGEGRSAVTNFIRMQTKEARATREYGKLRIQEGADLLKNPLDNTPVLLEFNDEGDLVPAKVKFYSFARALSMLVNMLVTLFLPVVIAAPIRLISMGEGEAFLDAFAPEYGAPWYVFAAFVVIIYWIRGVRSEVYERPIIYEIRPDGSKKLIGSFASRRVSVLSIFGIDGRDEDGKRLGVFGVLRLMGGMGILFALLLLFILGGSIAAILW